MREPESVFEAPAASDKAPADTLPTDVAELLVALGRPHAEVGRRVGPHRIHYTASFSLAPTSPIPTPKVGDTTTTSQEVEDELTLLWAPDDAEGMPHFSLRQANGSGGRETLAVDGRVYTRQSHRGWLARDVEGTLHERWLDDAARCVHDVVELAGPRVALGAGEDGTYTLALSGGAVDVPLPGHARSRWRARADLEVIEGSVTLGPEGVWRHANLDVGYRLGSGDGRTLRGRVKIRAELEPLESAPAVSPPRDAVPSPERRRYAVEADELLNGLAGR